MTAIQIYTDPETIRFIKKARKWLLLSGMLLMVIVFVSVIFPMLATIATELFIGWIFIFSGLFNLLIFFSYRSMRPGCGTLLIIFLSLLLGVFLISNPVAAAIILTILIAALFILDGVFGVFIALMRKPFSGWLWILLSAMISIFVGIILGVDLLGTPLPLLGLLVGIRFIISGLSCIMPARVVDS